jgi:hypothetical protein
MLLFYATIVNTSIINKNGSNYMNIFLGQNGLASWHINICLLRICAGGIFLYFSPFDGANELLKNSIKGMGFTIVFANKIMRTVCSFG